jgi:DNA-binding response OmpR family regulator
LPSVEILIVDDDEHIRALVTELLTRRGYTVVAAETGEDALAAARRQVPDLVLVDVHLPGQSGYEVCQEIRAEFGEAVPILFLSGVRTESYDRVAGLRLGGDDYIVKPFAPDELLARVDRFVERAAQNGHKEQAETFEFGLTRREIEVLRLLADGRSPKEVARDLSISHKTVSSHIQSIFAKLDVHTQAQAVSLAFINGLIL